MLTIFNVIIYYYIYIHNVWIFFTCSIFIKVLSHHWSSVQFSLFPVTAEIFSPSTSTAPQLAWTQWVASCSLTETFQYCPSQPLEQFICFNKKSFLSCLLSLGLLLFAAAFSGGGSEQILGFGCISSSTSSCPDTMDRPKVCFLGKWVHVLASLLLSYMLFYCSDLFYFYGVF